jgi:quercetin dioxygenase-like cupin family protein
VTAVFTLSNKLRFLTCRRQLNRSGGDAAAVNHETAAKHDAALLEPSEDDSMTLESRRYGWLLIAAGLIVLTEPVWPGAVVLTPAELKWESQGNLTAPGVQQLNLVGDPAKPGPYTIRLKFPKGFSIAPHTHPDSREVTILSGVFATGYGETFDAAQLKVLPAGSFYTEPANVPHFIEIEEDSVIQVSGTGPSGRKFINRHE